VRIDWQPRAYSDPFPLGSKEGKGTCHRPVVRNETQSLSNYLSLRSESLRERTPQKLAEERPATPRKHQTLIFPRKGGPIIECKKRGKVHGPFFSLYKASQQKGRGEVRNCTQQGQRNEPFSTNSIHKGDVVEDSAWGGGVRMEELGQHAGNVWAARLT